MKTKLPYTLIPNENTDTVQITYDTGKRNWHYGYSDIAYGQPICEYLSVSFDAAGGNERWAAFNYRLQRNPNDPLANWQNRESAVRYVTEDAVTAAEIMVKKLIAKREKLQRAGRKTWQYKLLAAKAKELGWPLHYATDLVNHDAYTLATVNPDVFLWSVREAGTWLFTDDKSLEWRKGVVNNCGRDKYYIVTSFGLCEVEAKQFAEYKFVEQ